MAGGSVPRVLGCCPPCIGGLAPSQRRARPMAGRGGSPTARRRRDILSLGGALLALLQLATPRCGFSLPWHRRPLVASAGAAAAAPGAVAVRASNEGVLERTTQDMNDGQILQNLNQNHGWRPIDMGADGNCLFLSIAPQVRAEDVAELHGRSSSWAEALGADLGQRWEALGARERSTLLRRMAMLDEADFLQGVRELRDGKEPLPSQAEWRIRELFKDLAEEFIHSGKTELAVGVSRWNMQGVYDRVREVVASKSFDEQLDFVLLHAEEYMAITGRVGNWAGSSEMVALASALRRPFAAYGNNWVSQPAISLDRAENGGWQVRPYFEAPAPSAAPAQPAVRVFQTNGGGHYQMLG